MKSTLLAWILLLGLTSGLCGRPSAASQQVAPSPSFECAKAKSPIDTTICTDRTLAERDQVLAALYAKAQVSALGVGRSSALEGQREWLKSRNGCGGPKIKNCLLRQYNTRIATLAVSTLFSDPKVSIAELNRQDPSDGAIYGAIFRYATIAGVQDRAHAVEPLIAGRFSVVAAQAPGGLLDDIPNTAAALKSDKTFGLYLNAASLEGSDRRSAPLTLPCAALLRRPGLIDALHAYYGSTLDNFLVADDCSGALPSIPALDALSKAAWKAVPDCDGTIRFAGYREASLTETAARLNRWDVWADRLKQPASAREARFRAKHTPMLKAASDELAGYYVAYFHLSQNDAAQRAQGGIEAILRSVLADCD